jgi:hypothetical protein
MIAASTVAKASVVAGALALAVGIAPHDDAPPRSVPARAAPPRAAPPAAGRQLDAASDAQARRMREVTSALGAELSAAARCRAAGFVECAAPALRHATVGGRSAAMLVGVVLAGVPAGRCANYLLRLQAANAAAGDDARWELSQLYDRGARRHHRAIAHQLALIGSMLRHAARAAPAGVCSAAADGPSV